MARQTITRKCSKCGAEKPGIEFGSRGTRAQCRACCTAKQMEWEAKRRAAKPARVFKQPARAATDLEIAYLAGLFDGEGMVHIRRAIVGVRRNPSYALEIQISNSHRRVMDWVVEHFGGFLIEMRELSAVRPQWKWVLRCQKARTVLETMLPYLVVKLQQAVVAIDFNRAQMAETKLYEAGRRGPIPRTPEQMAYKERAKQMLHHLKRPKGTLENFVFNPSLQPPISEDYMPKNQILTDEQVREIRNEYVKGGTPQRVFAARYGVSRGLVANIVRGGARSRVD
jgi:DNA-binding transcriptional regulator YiaG